MAQSFNTNLNNVARHYIQMLKVPVTITTLKEKLTQNPYYPSLYSISNVFSKFGIANEAYQLTEADIDKMEPPFITYCSGQNTGSDFVLVTKITETSISYIAETNKPKELTREQFLKQWQGSASFGKTVFIAEANAQSGEPDFATKHKAENLKTIKQKLLYAGVFLLIGLMAYMFIVNAGAANMPAASTIMLVKLLGVGITVLLLIYEIDKTNSFVKTVCSAGKQTNCDAVLNSKAGKILGMGWGEVGFFYFATTTLFLLLPGLAFAAKLPWLAIASTVASPYILFSIYYQWRVVKQWCPLCLAVQAVLVMELIWAIIYFWLKSLLTSSTLPSAFVDGQWVRSLIAISFCILLPIIIWYLVKPIFLAAKAASGYTGAYKRLLYNPEIFNSLLQQQTTAPDGWQHLGINIGNPNAATTILKVCNPYCGPCAKAHSVLEEIIKHNANVQLKIIFTATNNENDITNKPAKHLLAIAAKENSQLNAQALDDWYLANKKDYDVFAGKYPMNGELKEQDEKIELMSKWCNDGEITATPTFFINGKRLPETYNINELKNIF
jgi:uncharacterized membrane protein